MKEWNEQLNKLEQVEKIQLNIKLADISDAELINEAIKKSQKSLEKFMGHFVNPLPSVEDTKKFLEKSIKKAEEGLGYQLVLKDRENFVALVGLNKKEEDVYELGGWMAEDYQGSGEKSLKVLEESLKFAFENKNTSKIISLVKPDNLSSLKVNIRAGLNLDGFQKRFSKSKQEDVYEVRFVLTKEGWDEIQKNGVDVKSSTKVIREIRDLYQKEIVKK